MPAHLILCPPLHPSRAKSGRRGVNKSSNLLSVLPSLPQVGHTCIRNYFHLLCLKWSHHLAKGPGSSTAAAALVSLLLLIPALRLNFWQHALEPQWSSGGWGSRRDLGWVSTFRPRCPLSRCSPESGPPPRGSRGQCSRFRASDFGRSASCCVEPPSFLRGSPPAWLTKARQRKVNLEWGGEACFFT